MTSRSKSVAAVILAAGRGTRMNSDIPKVLHTVCGKPILEHVLDAVWGAGIRQIFVIAGYGEQAVRSFAGRHACRHIRVIRQAVQLGTGHAVMCACPFLKNRFGSALILPGDTPCVQSKMLRQFVSAHEASGAVATVAAARFQNPNGYGRILRHSGGAVAGIREELDASESERAITEVNSGMYVFHVPSLFRSLSKVRVNARKQEYYLTDVIAALVREGGQVRGYSAEPSEEMLGVNSRADLAAAERILSKRELDKHQRNGVTIISPENTFIASGVTIGKDSVVYPFSWIETQVTIGKRCQIGPFALIRSKSEINDSAVVGSFVEVTRSRIGKMTRVKHLSYLGDADLGTNVNIGAGMITANFDGSRKHRTRIRNGAFIGSNAVLVAPVDVGPKAKVGAGSVVLARTKIPAGKTVAGVPARPIQKKKKN